MRCRERARGLGDFCPGLPDRNAESHPYFRSVTTAPLAQTRSLGAIGNTSWARNEFAAAIRAAVAQRLPTPDTERALETADDWLTVIGQVRVALLTGRPHLQYGVTSPSTTGHRRIADPHRRASTRATSHLRLDTATRVVLAVRAHQVLLPQ